MIRSSSGLDKLLLGSDCPVKNIIGDTGISLGDGDGGEGRDTINSVTVDLSIFTVGAFVKIVTPVGDTNRNTVVKVIQSTASKLEVAAGSFASYAAGANVYLVELDIGGSLETIYQNGTLHFFAESRQANADMAEPGTPVLKITLNGQTFTPGSPANGINVSSIVGTIMGIAIDPETSAKEIWRGTPLQVANIRSARFYANSVVTGYSEVEPRIDYTVTGELGGGDIELRNGTAIDPSIPVDINDFRFQVGTGSFTG
jgi:hypothetical protein